MPGLTGTNAAFLVPDHIRKKFAEGWNIHVPLTFLTDKGCLLKNKPLAGAAQEVLSIDSATGRIITTSKPLSDNGELDLTFDEWHQAWRRLLDLIKTFLPEEFLMWETHYLYILNNENRAELWPLYLAYDAEIRKRATQLSIDPSVFSIGIWNDLEVRYTAKKVLSLVQSDLRQLPDRSAVYAPNPQLPNNDRTVSQGSSFRNQQPSSDVSKTGRCIFCGDRSKTHLSRNCTASSYANGTPCHLCRQEPVYDRVNPASVTALPGTVPQAVTNLHPAGEVNTSVHYAARLCTLPNTATPLPDLLIINTPFLPDVWERMLNDISPVNNFSDVPNSIRIGFDMGVHSPPLHTYTPPNHNSATSFPDHVMSHIHNELSLRRYSGPFSQSRLEFLIGPFRTSPLSTVLKTVDSVERRIVQDLSFPRNDPTCQSVNSQINIDDFRCDWGTLNDIRAIVIDAPLGSEAATLDVNSAFRCCPILPSQQRNFIIRWNDAFFIDHNAPFGATSAGGVFGRVADAKSAILASKGFGPSKNWVDDFVFFRFPISLDQNPPSFSYSLSDIYALAIQLGWPWKESKTRPFATEFKYLGFLWDLSTKSVCIPEAKKLRYLSKLDSWVSGNKFSRKEAESVLGTLVHCSLALPDGRSRLPALSRFVASFNYLTSSFVRRSPNPSVISDISWWRTHLSSEFCGSLLSRPPNPSPVEFWVDASSSWGIGIVFGGEWDAWCFHAGWDKDGRNIGWAEFVAIELGLLFAIHHGYSDIHFTIKSDNQGVIHAIQGGRSRSPGQNLVLQRITSLLSQHKFWISSLYVHSVDNLADPPSRGLPAPNRTRAISSFALPFCLHPFLSRAPC